LKTRSRTGSAHAAATNRRAVVRTPGLQDGKASVIAEILELEQVLHIMGINELDAGMRDLLLPFLAKTKEDRKRLTLSGWFASLVLNCEIHATRLSAAELVGVGT